MSTKAAELARHTNVASITVPTDWVPITASADALNPPIRALRANGAGTVTATMASGVSRTLNFLSGETRYGAITHVTAATATGLEGGV